MSDDREIYLYVLRLDPRLHAEAAWTDGDRATVAAHFQYPSKATGEAAAQEFMESDPAIVAGVMSATLHPYAIALQRKS